MSKKQRPPKKMTKAESEEQYRLNSAAIQGADSGAKTKPLIMTPQIPVAIHGTYPEQYLVVEQPNASGSRKKVKLTPDNAYQVLLEILMEKAGEIELERQLAAERKQSGPRKRAQPDFRLIAQHPEVTIIERLATRAKELASNKADKSLEEMGL